MSRRFDVVVFGASGFVGQFVVEEITRVIDKTMDSFTWAIAGRSKTKLEEVLKQASQATGVDVTNTHIIEANVENFYSLIDMTKSAHVIINCVGPYTCYGEAVVKACIQGGCHYVDLCAETHFSEEMELLYHRAAEETGIYVINACGHIALLPDVGLSYLQQELKGDLKSVQCFLEIESGIWKTVLHLATLKSMVYVFSKTKELREIRKKRSVNNNEDVEPASHPNPKRARLHYNYNIHRWAIEYVTTQPEEAVINRSQRDWSRMDHRPQVQIQCFLSHSNFFTILFTLAASLLLWVYSQFALTRAALLKFPRLMTLGFMSKNGPTRKQAESLQFSYTLVAEGRENRLVPGEEQTKLPNKKTILKISGKNPAYGAAIACVVQAALTILKESHKMPSKGGVFTPGVAFAKTTIVERLKNVGLTFEIQ